MASLLCLIRPAEAAIAPEKIGPWTVVTDQAPFSPRDNALGAVFQGKMWLSHGYPEFVTDLWSSSDGVTWNQVLAETPYDLFSHLVSFDGKLWAVSSTVWSSEDGITWTEVLAGTPFMYGQDIVVHDGRMWALGNGPEVWSSIDGVNWVCATLNAAYGNRNAPAVAEFDGKLWLMGGSTPAPATGCPTPQSYCDIYMNNDVWSSTDGTTWTLVTEHAPWRARMWCVAQSYAGRLWLLAGYDNEAFENLSDTWYTTDGVNWQQESQVALSWSPRHFPTAWVLNDALWVAAGKEPPYHNDVWKLTASLPTTTSLDITPNPATYGLTVTLTATVTPSSAGGSIEFKDGSTTLQVVDVSAGAASASTSSLPAGSHLITAIYSGDATYASSSSSAGVEILPAASPPVIGKSFESANIPFNGTTTLTFTISNPNAGMSLSSVGFTDDLPDGLIISTPNRLTGSCGGGVISAAEGSSMVSLTGAVIDPSAVCTFSIGVDGTTAGTKNNQTSAPTSAEGGPGTPAQASLEVLAPPSISMMFAAPTMPLNGTTSLTFTITNPTINALPLSDVAFTDALPSGLAVATPNGQTGSCTNAVITATAGSGSIALSGATIAPGDACTFAVDITGLMAGTFNNSTSSVTSANGGTGNSASASVQVIGPDLAVTKAHTGDFAQGETGRTYTLEVTNVGEAPTSASVVVTDTLPTGLSATAISGTGWNCILATLTCTREDVLTAAATYPAIVVTVNVSSNAPSGVTNTAHVSGGGEINTTNNDASDVTTVLTGPDLTIAKTHIGNFAAGQTGRTYTITISNAGQSPTSGMITVGDTLPFGLTAISITGTDWACGVGTLVCSRSDTLSPGSSYPPIIVTVNVNDTAPPILVNTAHVSGGGEFVTANDTADDPTIILIAPANISATATSTSQVTLSWDAVAGATNYRISRSSDNGPFAIVGFTPANSFSDIGLTPNTTYVYVVRATDALNVGPVGNPDIATTILFADDPAVPGSTVIKALHIQELRLAINAVRAAAGQPAATFDASVAAGAFVKATDIAELRFAIDEARAALGLNPIAYTDPALTGAFIKAAHIRELRNGVK